MLPVGKGSNPLADVIDEPLPLRRPKSRSKGSWIGLCIGILVFAAAAGGIGYTLSQKPVPALTASTRESPAATPTVASQEASSYSKAALENDPNLVAEFLPTNGDPVQLLMMPSGVNFVVHFRPALLWSDAFVYRVLRASLTDDVTNWIASQIQTHCRRPPEQIEEVTFGFILGARGMDPQICTLVRLKEPVKLSTLISEFPGKYLFDIAEKPDVRLKVDEKHGYLIGDEKTYAICPASLAHELEFWVKTPNHEVSEGIADQLKRTDRNRLLTAIGTRNDLEIHLQKLFPQAAQPLAAAILEWLGSNVETVGWSLHPDPYLHSQIFLRSTNVTSPAVLQREFEDRFQKLPEHVWKDVCEKMNPTEVRFRKLIGRLPAMLQAFQEATVAQRTGRNVVMTTVLPAKAAPNLSLATLFTVNEAARTDFNAAPVVASNSGRPAMPATLVERIELPVDAEFINTPLDQAVQFLCDEVQLKLHVDGDALKDAGYTRNMKQAFNLGKVPMRQALLHIVNTYQEPGKEMVVSFDEAQMQATLTTRKFAQQQGLKISLPPAN